MNNFKKEGFRKGNGGFGGKPRFGGEKRFGGGDRGSSNFGQGDREMFKAKCSSCFQQCEVPFRPTSGKPVFCKDCFRDNAPDEKRSFQRSDSRGGDFRKDTRSAPREERPRHDERAPQTHGNEDVKRQLATLEAKMDHILELLKPKTAPKETAKAVVIKEVVAAEEAPKKVRKPKTVKAAKTKAPAKKKAAKKTTK